MLAGTEIGAAAARLGEARGSTGVGVGETIDDFACLFRAAGLDGPPLEAVRALCQGWADAVEAAPVFTQCVDPESGLPTVEYFAIRLAEVYGVAARRQVPAGETHALVVVDVATEHSAPWRRMARSAAMGRALGSAHGTGHPMASLGGGVFTVLIERDETLGEQVRRLRDAVQLQATALRVGDIMRQPPRIWIEPLPETHAAAVEVLASLRR